ncbi:MAG: hypothetical protein KAV45_14775 [Calditrichia bacterium]|nr:hypothetical protein [Calditrichia bacterium]
MDITYRFLNIISLFNGIISLVSIQTNSVQLIWNISVISITILHQIQSRLVKEDEEIHGVAEGGVKKHCDTLPDLLGNSYRRLGGSDNYPDNNG